MVRPSRHGWIYGESAWGYSIKAPNKYFNNYLISNNFAITSAFKTVLANR
jgi:hypothetical protein